MVKTECRKSKAKEMDAEVGRRGECRPTSGRASRKGCRKSRVKEMDAQEGKVQTW